MASEEIYSRYAFFQSPKETTWKVTKPFFEHCLLLQPGGRKHLCGTTNSSWKVSLKNRCRKDWCFYYPHFRSSHRRCSVKKGVLRKFAKFTGKCPCQSLFIKKETLAQVFSVNFAKFLRTPSLQNTSGWLLLTFKSWPNFEWFQLN